MAIDIRGASTNAVSIFTSVANRLQDILGTDVQVHHVGSTAVPGIDGKNIIDILVSAGSHTQISELKNKLIAAGYFMSQKSTPRDDYVFLASREEETGEGDVHIHLAIKGTKIHDDFLVLRDYLRYNTSEADSYSKIKHAYAQQAGYDRSIYKRLKSAYVNKLIERARQWQESSSLH